MWQNTFKKLYFSQNLPFSTQNDDSKQVTEKWPKWSQIDPFVPEASFNQGRFWEKFALFSSHTEWHKAQENDGISN